METEGQGMDGVWHKATDRMHDELGPVGYETWIGPLNFLGLQNGIATIEAPNRFFHDWVHDHYLDQMRKLLAAEVGERIEIKLIVGKEGNGNGHSNGRTNCHSNGVKATAPVRAPASPSSAPERRGLHPQLNPRYTFDEFVWDRATSSRMRRHWRLRISLVKNTTRYLSTVVLAWARPISRTRSDIICTPLARVRAKFF
jgi:chromosomal replication initiation ATPase DnaA